MSSSANKDTSDDSSTNFKERVISYYKNPCIKDLDVVNLCKEKAEEGDNDAMLWLARMYRDGKGVKKNDVKALEWYKKSKNNNIFSRFELLVMLSNQERNFKDAPEGLKIDKRKKEQLLVYKFDCRCMDLIVNLFPFTHYNVVGFSYENENQIGYNENCKDYEKVLIANIDYSHEIKEELILEGVEENEIITVRLNQNKGTFDGPSIICDFDSSKIDKKTWVMVPDELHGLMWFVIKYKLFKDATMPNYNYIVDMQNHFTQLMEIQDLGHYNPWEYYFKSDSLVSLEEAYSGCGVILSSWMPKNTINMGCKPTLSETILKKIDIELEKAGTRKKVLGIICRGTDYISMQPYNHGVPLDAYELIEIADERMNALGFTDIYLNTEDQVAYDAFIEHFGTKMYAIEQNRFKRENVLNAELMENKIPETFGKLIQGERYLIATYLMLMCDSALTCYGAGSSFVRSNMGQKVVENHTKGNWGRFGKKPLIVRSHNKNHFSLLKATHDGSADVFVDSNGLLNNMRGKEIVFTGAEIYLSAGVEYVCSFINDGTNSASLSLILSFENGKKDIICLFHGSVFSVPFDTFCCTAIVKCTSVKDSVIGIQIEEGKMPTKYESYRYSETRICLKDDNYNEYDPDFVDHIDLNKGVVFSHGIEHVLNYEEIERYHGIICYSNGFLTYHSGTSFLGVSKFGPANIFTGKKQMGSIRITGDPKQLRRFSYTIELADLLITGSKGKIEKALCIYSYHAMNGSVNAEKRLARIYRDGIGVKKDIDRAINFMRNAVNSENGQPNNDYVDLLIQRGNDNDLEEAFCRARDYANRGDHGSKWRLSRMYRDGKGVQKDLDKAIELMREVALRRISWSRNEFVDMLHMRGKESDLKEAFNIANNYASEGNEGAIYRLARMYRDGKGVDKDINKAIEWMRKSSDKWYGWSRSELMDLLWQRGNPQDLTEMRNVAELTIEKGNPLVKAGALGRLGRIYRDGKGVEKNIGKAIEFMQKAVEINHVWNKELQNLQREKR